MVTIGDYNVCYHEGTLVIQENQGEKIGKCKIYKGYNIEATPEKLMGDWQIVIQQEPIKDWPPEDQKRLKTYLKTQPGT